MYFTFYGVASFRILVYKINTILSQECVDKAFSSMVLFIEYPNLFFCTSVI